MARNKTLPQRATGFWESGFQPFLKRWSLALALVLIAIASARIAATYTDLFLTADEPIHFACGLQYLAEHVYRYEPQHPPLTRAMAALLPYLAGARPAGEVLGYRETEVVATRSGDPRHMLALMRAGILPFFVLAGLVVYFWSRHHFGNVVALIATGLFTLLPPVLAHAGLATTDMGLTALLGAAFFALVRWAESPTWKRTALLAVTAALAALTKFTSLIYLPAAAVLALLAWLAVERPGKRQLLAVAKARAPRFGAAVLMGALVIWAGYWFSVGNVVAWDMTLPAPAFFQGIQDVLSHNATGHMAYLLGQSSETGWWYYFPVVLAVKTPIAFLLLLGLGLYVCYSGRASVKYSLPAAFSLGILLPAMSGNINIGVRHILPVYMGFSIMAALAVVRLAKWSSEKKWAGPLAAVLLLWLAISGARSHPDYIAYFNELVPGEREKVLVDSDLDWGQDVYRLARRLHELGVTQISLGSLIHVSDEMMKWTGLPPMKPINPVAPAEGWTVVSPTLDKTTQYGLMHRYPNVHPWYESLQPKERVGALILYYVPPK